MTVTPARPSPIAGTWYAGNPKRLAAEIDAYLNDAQLPDLQGEVIAVIAPHAGHRYSGHVAGHAFAALCGRAPDLVVVLAPFHQFAPHPLLTTAHAAYSTPLGNIAVDTSALAELQSALTTPIMAIANDREHALEIELPFLQRALSGDFQLLPIMVRGQEPALSKELGDALAKILADRNALLVASTDLSHFYDSHTAKIFDEEMLARFSSGEPDSIFQAEQTGKGFACGHAAVAAMLYATRGLGATKVHILKYATSGDITGDNSSVVGYAAAAVLRDS